MLSDERSQAMGIINQSRTKGLNSFCSAMVVFTLQALNLI